MRAVEPIELDQRHQFGSDQIGAVELRLFVFWFFRIFLLAEQKQTHFCPVKDSAGNNTEIACLK